MIEHTWGILERYRQPGYCHIPTINDDSAHSQKSTDYQVHWSAIKSRGQEENRGNYHSKQNFQNPKTKVVDPKTVYFEKVDDLIICSGAYKK